MSYGKLSGAYQEGWRKGWSAGIEAAERCLAETGTIYGLTEKDLRRKYDPQFDHDYRLGTTPDE